MSKRNKVTCNDCYFRQLALCALQLDEPCPTFRLQDHGLPASPRQAPLIPRALEPVASVRFLPQHQAAACFVKNRCRFAVRAWIEIAGLHAVV